MGKRLHWIALLYTGMMIAAVSGGCVRQYNVDLKQQRQTALDADMPLIKPEPLNVSESLALEDVIRIGLENNLEIRISKAMSEISDDRLKAEKLKMLPNLDVGADFSYRNKDRVEDSENIYTGEVFPGRTISEEKTSHTMNISLSWNILDFGLSYIRARQAAIGTEIQRMERMRQAQMLAFDLSAAYWRSVLAGQDLEYLQNIETELKAYKVKADEMVAQRRLDPISVKSIEKRLVDLSITANKLQADVSGSRLELCRLMGINPAAEFTLAAVDLVDYIDAIPDPGSMDTQALETIALTNRAELFAADMEMTIQKEEARAMIVSMFPGIRFHAGQYYDGNKYLADNTWMSVGTGLATNLLQLPTKYMQYRAQNKMIDKTRLQRILLSAGIIAQTHMALHDFMIRQQQYKLYHEAHAISNNLLTMTRDKHAVGKVVDTIMVQRMVENIVSRLERDRSVVELVNSYNMLMVTLGLDYPQWNKEEIL